jgi:hypothetical protein
MNGLRWLGVAFLVAGAGVWLADPTLHAMGNAWLVTGAVLVGVGQLGATGAALEARLRTTGQPGRATILSVTDTGVTLNHSPRVRFRVRIDRPGAPSVEATRAIFVSRLGGPRVGEVHGVRFDPDRPDDFVFVASKEVPILPPPAAAPRAEEPLGALERLADLRDRGALTEDEFQAAKQAILQRL